MQKMSPEEELQELLRQHQALAKSCFSITLCSPVLPVWPLLTQTSCLGSCPCTLVWSQAGKAGKAMQAAGHDWKNSSRVCVCVRKGSGRKSQAWHEPQSMRPSRSFLSSALLPQQSNIRGSLTTLSTSVSTILLSQCQNFSCSWPAEQTLAAQQPSRAGHFSPTHHRQGVPWARTASKQDQDVQPSRTEVSLIDLELSGCWTQPMASLCQAPVPCQAVLGATVLAAEPHARGTEHEPGCAQGPGNVCDGWTRFLSHQQGRWAG